MAAFLAHRDPIGDSRSYIRPDAGILDAWNAIEQPMTFLESPQYWPLSLFFTDPANLDTKQTGARDGCQSVDVAPFDSGFRFGQTYLEAGLTKGAVKG